MTPPAPRAASGAELAACVVPLVLVTLCATTVGHMPGMVEVLR